MKILVYSDYSVLNHSVRPEAEIFLQLARLGHMICVCSPSFDERQEFSRAGMKTLATGQRSKICYGSIKKLHREIKTGEYDIVFATSSRTIPTAAFACIGLPARLVVYRGTTRGLKRRDPTSFLSVLHPRVDAVVTVSEAVSSAVRKKLLNRNIRICSIFKGHNIDWYTDKPADLSEFGIPQSALVVIAVARFRPSKGLQYLLSACDKLADIKNLHLLVVGSGADQEPYTTLIRRCAMRQRIHLTGRREDALNLIASADLLVQPSVDGEGLPRSIIEALSFGKPIISTSAGGAQEVIINNQTGFIVAPRDSAAIADRIRFLAENSSLRAAMSEQCKQLVRDELSHTRTAKAYEQFFNTLMSAS